jgi:hypothetical protein
MSAFAKPTRCTDRTRTCSLVPGYGPTTRAWCPNPAGKSAGGDLHSGSGDPSSGFHTYGLEWTPDVLRFYYDCVLVWTVNNSPQLDLPSQMIRGVELFPVFPVSRS